MKVLKLSIIFFFVFANINAKSSLETRIDKLTYIINKLHYSHQDFDKTFVRKSLPILINNLDPEMIYLYKSDCDMLFSIADEDSDLKSSYLRIYKYLIEHGRTSLHQNDSLINVITNEKLLWSKSDTLKYSNEFTNNYPKNVLEKSQSIRKWYKYLYLTELDNDDKLEVTVSDSVIKRIKLKVDKHFNNIFITDEEDFILEVEKNILDAIAQTTDPHSSYMLPNEKKAFNNMLSATIERYGFTMSDDDNVIKISSIKPGSAAWKSNQLNIGDRLLKIRFKNGKLIDVTSMTKEECSDLFSNSVEKEVDLHIEKLNGITQKVHLKKEIIHSDENTINSYLLNSDSLVGYIALPSFYTDFSESNALGCANDVAKEIVKLKQENIKGLIIDLRNNGGGSVEEAINLAGIFIDVGPLCYDKYKKGKPQLYKDFNRGLIYDGPLIILINNFSASASELLATMLKTHKRAVVMGNCSYGKATSQVVVPLDTSISMYAQKNNFDEEDGFVKITISKFYDLNGNTHQLNGVAPDITVPSIYQSLEYSEKNELYPLSNDKNDKKINLNLVTNNLLEEQIKSFNMRIMKEPYYDKITKCADSLKVMRENSKHYVLLPKEYKIQMTKINKYEERFKLAMQNAESSIIIRPNKKLGELANLDITVAELIKNNIESWQKDILLHEANNFLISLKK